MASLKRAFGSNDALSAKRVKPSGELRLCDLRCALDVFSNKINVDRAKERGYLRSRDASEKYEEVMCRPARQRTWNLAPCPHPRPRPRPRPRPLATERASAWRRKKVRAQALCALQGWRRARLPRRGLAYAGDAGAEGAGGGDVGHAVPPGGSACPVRAAARPDALLMRLADAFLPAETDASCLPPPRLSAGTSARLVSWCYRSEPDVLRSTSAKCRSFACSSRATRCARRLA